MFSIKHKPYQLFIPVILILVICSGIFAGKNLQLYLHVFDTYFIVGYNVIFILLALPLFIIWLGYYIAKRNLLSKAMTNIHVFVTLITIILFIVSIAMNENFPPVNARRYYDYSVSGTETSFLIRKFLATLMSVLLLGQLLFIINIIGGIVKGARKGKG